MILNHLKNKKFTIFYLKYSQFSNHLDSNNFLLEKINNILYIHDRAYGIFKIDNPQIAKILSTQIFKKSLKILFGNLSKIQRVFVTQFTFSIRF